MILLRSALKLCFQQNFNLGSYTLDRDSPVTFYTSNFAYSFNLVAPLNPGPGYTGQVLYRDATQTEASGRGANAARNMYRVEPPSDCCQSFKTCLEPDIVYRCSKNFIGLGGAVMRRAPGLTLPAPG